MKATATVENKYIRYTEALDLLSEHVTSFGREKALLSDAVGRVLAESIWADRSYPSCNRAAVDGYVMRLADLEEGIRAFKVLSVPFAAQQNNRPPEKRWCAKLLMGAVVPDWADVLVPKEEVVACGDEIILNDAVHSPYQHIVQKGEQVQGRDMLLPVHTPCNPSVLGLLASVGRKTVMVEKLPRVALITTGNEVVPVGAPVNDWQVRNSNKYLLHTLLNKWKIKPDISEHIPDSKVLLTACLRKALCHDVVVLSGGISAGGADLVPQVLEEFGVEVIFHKVAIKPGRAVYFGKLPHGGVVFALPGNPFACLVAFTLFIESYLYACFGLHQPVYQATLLEQHDKKGDYTEFFPVAIDTFASGVRPIVYSGPGDIRAGVGAHALGIHPSSHEELRKGAAISVIPFNNSLL